MLRECSIFIHVETQTLNVLLFLEVNFVAIRAVEERLLHCSRVVQQFCEDNMFSNEIDSIKVRILKSIHVRKFQFLLKTNLILFSVNEMHTNAWE